MNAALTFPHDAPPAPGEFTDVASRHPGKVRELEEALLARFRATHPEADQEPKGGREEGLDFYLRPRDA